MKRIDRRGAMEASLMILLATILLVGVVVTLTRSVETSRHAARAEMATALTTAIESMLSEAWWQVSLAIPRGGGTGEAGAADGVKSLELTVLAALADGNATAGTYDLIPVPVTATTMATTAPGIVMEQPRLTVHSIESNGTDGVVAVSAGGRIQRAGVTVAFRVEHRHTFHVERSSFTMGEATETVSSVNVGMDLVDVEIKEL